MNFVNGVMHGEIFYSIWRHYCHRRTVSCLIDRWELISSRWLTWQERIVRTKRTAATTRYFSFLRVNVKTFSITLSRRKLHLKTEEKQSFITKLRVWNWVLLLES
jgi:hypothetical protein